MIINKVTNNNIVSVIENNTEKIVMGRGLGFNKKPGDSISEDKIEKIFVMNNENHSHKFKELIVDIPLEHMLLGGTKYNQGGLGIFAIINYISPEGKGLPAVLITIAVASLIGFLLTYLFWKDEEVVENKNETVNTANTENTMKTKSEVLVAPIEGKVVKLENIKDQAFASGTLGKGYAIEPKDGKVYSPVDGTVSMLFGTNHAIGITSDSGLEILIHFGMDTVQLEGKGFKAHVKQGDKIKAGQLLLDVDLDVLKDGGYESITPVVITNYDDLLDLILLDKEEVKEGDDLIRVLF